MCLILRASVRKLLSLNLEEAQRLNPHGWGYADAQQNVMTSFRTKDTLRESLMLRHSTAIMTVHFRWATHGPVIAENCHPFDIGRGRLLFHNGRVDGFGSGIRSDTQELAELIYDQPWMIVARALENCSATSRFLVTKDGSFKKFGSGWCELDGVLASNRQIARISPLVAKLLSPFLPNTKCPTGRTGKNFAVLSPLVPRA